MKAASDVWELIHRRKLPAKKAAELLGLTLYELYERLAVSQTQRDVIRSSTGAAAPAADPRSDLDGETRARARAAALLASGYQARDVARRMRRPLAWVSALRTSMTIG